MDLYFTKWLGGKDRRRITTVVILLAVAGFLGFIVNLNYSFIHPKITIGKALGAMLILVFLWLRSPTNGLYVASIPHIPKMLFIKASLIASALVLFGIFTAGKILFGIEEVTIGRVAAVSLAVSLYWMYK